MRADGVDVPDSIRAGEGGNYYMCPEFWCPVSEVPMTQQQVQENGGVCTSGEQPLDLTSASFWSQGSKRSPGLLAAPSGFQARPVHMALLALRTWRRRPGAADCTIS
jgi:hypothetical protein